MADSKEREAALAKVCEALDTSLSVILRLKPDHPDRVEHDRLADALQHERDKAELAVVTLAENMIVGEPKPYRWAKQNYNAGHDQALHALVKELRRRRVEGG